MADSDSSDADSIEWDWQPTLQEKIKDILSQYPDDVQILKEIIQNAEDADAKCVKFLYDKNSYTTEGLIDETSVGHQGEALYAYNDAVFTKEDFHNLLNVRKSAKKTDRSKVGRFGQGFKSVFHMTELPTLLSGKYLAKISPYLPRLPRKKHSELNKHHPAELNSFRGEFQGYNNDAARKRFFNGTIFRFPLRKQPSEISKTLYGEEKIMELFRVLQDRAYMNLLFLKSLERIEVFVQDVKQSKPRLLFSVCVTNENSDTSVLQTRAEFFRELQVAGNVPVKKQCHFTYQIDIETSLPEDDSHCQSFLVCHYYDGCEVSSTMKELIDDKELSYQPLVSVAMPLCEEICEDSEQKGHIFCFLPLPIRDNTSPTGLPVHVSSFFVVSSNRSEIKWPTAGQNREQMSDSSLKWNHCLLTELIPKAYAQLLLDATGEPTVQSEDVYHAFPDIDLVDEKWRNTFLEPFLQNVLSLPILATEGGNKSYVSVRDAVLCPPNIDEKTRLVLIQLLTESGYNAVCPPEHISRVLKSRRDIQLEEATAYYVCQVMRRSACYKSYSRDDKLLLLSYLLGENPVTPAALRGLELLPLADGTFTTFGPSTSSSIFIAESKHQLLLPTLEHRFMSNDLGMNLDTKLRQSNMICQTQLALCADEDILSLLPSIFPGGCESLRTIDCKELRHITEIWLQHLWQFLTSICSKLPDHLERIKNLHILPVKPLSPKVIHLTKLFGGATCIAKDLRDENLSDQLAKTLGYFNITVLDDIPDYILRHPLVFQQHWIYNPNPESVIRALLKVRQTDHSIVSGSCKFNQHANREQRFELVKLIQPHFKSMRHGSTLKPFVEHLELFETIDGSGTKRRHFTSVAKCPKAVTGYNIPVSSPCMLLDVGAADVRQMATYVGVNIMTETKIIEDYIFDLIRRQRLQPLEVGKVMVYVLQNLHDHIRGSKKFLQHLQELAFMTDSKGIYCRVCDFFDPSDSVLQNLFLAEDKFPPDIYQRCLESLRRIGLKDRRKVNGQDLLNTAKLVAKCTGTSKKKQKKNLELKIQGMSEVLLQNQNLLHVADTNEQLRQIAWVPVRLDRPGGYPKSLAWGCVDQKFQTPTSMCLSSEIDVVGSAMPCVDTKFVSDVVFERVLGKRLAPLPSVIGHLKNIVNYYRAEEKVVLMGFVQKVYEVLRLYPVPEVQKCLTSMKLVNWVWHGNGFASVDCIILEQLENFAPYAYSLPDELSGIRSWLDKMGVKNDFDCLQILQRIKRYHDGASSVNPEMVTRDLRIVKHVLQKIVSQCTEGYLGSRLNVLLLPVQNDDERLQLLPACDCTYAEDEAYVLGASCIEDDDESESDLNYIHHAIPKELANALGVKTSMNRLLEEDSEGISILESHGQVESLTHRLKLLIQDYPDGLAIPKELIQNADDAGATVVKFLYDERENLDAMDGLLDEGMKECQGPALWVYNDAEFSEDDLKNIAKLSGATKENRSDKIGKFGLGFNVVYNVTDVPSFITNRSIVFLDPHRSHLGKAKKEKSDTGLQLNICSNSRQGAHIRRKYYNQFRTYDGVFGCQLRRDGEQKPFKGTLFRLPLRPSGAKSEINSMPYTKDDIKELFQLIIDQASSLLLFVQSVKSVELHHLPRSACDPSKSVQLFHLETKLEQVLSRLPRLPPAVSTENPNLLTIASRITRMVEREYRHLPKDISRTSVVATSQKFTNSTSTRDLSINGQTKKILWLVHDCIGTNESMTDARQSPSRSYVPTAGVAIQLELQQRNKYQPVRFDDGMAPVFCHLPLPSSVKSGLPVIVNGSFAIKSDRRQIVQITSDDKLNNPMDVWNENLKRDAITNAYLGTLVQMKELLTSHRDLYSLWPDRNHIAKGFETFLQSFYRTLATLNENTSPKIFTNGVVWVDFGHTVFMDEALSNTDLCDVALDILQKHLDRTTPVRDRVIATVLPRHLRDGFPANVVKSKTFDLAKIYKAAILPFLPQLNSEKRDKLLLFALKRAKGNVQLRKLLVESACIPVGQDGTRFVKPTQLISPNGRRATLYEIGDNVFPIASFCADKTLGVLKELGMNVDEISWDMVMERARSIGSLNECQQEARLKQWVPYAEQKLQSGVEMLDRSQLVQLREIRFLPVLPKPENYPIIWKGDNYQRLVSAEEAYPSRHQNLVSSTSPIVDERICGLSALHRSCKIREHLGLLGRNVSLEAVLQQLKVLSAVPISRENRSTVRDMCHEMYSHLESCCKNSPDVDASIIKHKLSGSRCLLADDVFMEPSHCAMQGSDIPHYLHVIQYPLNRQQLLLKLLNVKKQFHGADFVQALNRIDFDAGVKVVRDIAEGLHSWLQHNKGTLEDALYQCQEAVLLPTDVNAEGDWDMLPVDELCLNARGDLVNQSTPRTWLRNTVGNQKFRYLHPDIPFQVAQALGVRSDRENVLSRLGTPLGQPFGQKEPLTTRIKSILQNYPCDEGVLKELLQNADDAGATELRFILDKRQHREERVFDENWKLLQGPALCVYNNMPFTEKDLGGICSLGQGSKSSDPTKTGQYGIGFNSVYHLTDVPSFLTDGEEIGRTFGILDPNCRYAPGACQENPGRCFQEDDFETVHTDFTDVFSGYLESHLELKGATLFRLPLRSQKMSETSKISTKVVTIDFAEKLLRLFEAELFQNLLFVNSVRTISLESLGQVHEKKYSVRVQILKSDEQKLREFNKYVKKVSDELHNDRLTLENVEYREVTYIVRMEDSKGQVQIWSVCQCIGFREKCEIPNVVAQAVAAKDLALLPRGGAALLLDSNFQVKGRQVFCFLPLPSREDTKLPVHINGHFALDSARRTLWDDGRSCPGYKSMWNSFMMEKIVAQAYVSLLMNECNRLKRKQNVSQEDLQKFYNMFPDISKIKANYLNELVSAFYTTTHLDTECLAVQTEMENSVATRWFNISQCVDGEAFFDNLSPTRIKVTRYEPIIKPAFRNSVLTGNQQSQKKHTTTEIDHIHSLTNILRRLGFNLLSVPMFIFFSLRMVKINVRQVEPRTVLEYMHTYRDHRDCTLKHLPQPVIDSPFQDGKSVVELTKYCYSTRPEADNTKSLVGLPLCLTDDEVIQEFSQSQPRFHPRFSSLVPHHANHFVDSQVFGAVPLEVREKKPLALVELTIKKLAPLLLPAYQDLHTNYRIEWEPKNENKARMKRWIENMWKLISSEIDKVFEDLKGNREAALKRLEPLKEFCIVPAHDTNKDKHFLYQLKYAKCIRYGSSLSWGYMGMNDTIQKLLMKAGIPCLDTLSLDFMPSLRLSLPREIASHVENPRDILYALWDLLQHGASATRLTQATGNRRDALHLREYFASLFKKKCTSEEATRLRQLPIHQFVNDKISSLGNCGCYLVPQGIPKAGLDNWYSKNTPEKFVFLTGSDVDQLYRTLGAVEKTAVDLYVELILMRINFQQFLNEEEQFEHLDYVARVVIPQLNHSSREYEALIASLQNLPFLKNPHGNLELAKEFFDPNVQLFKAMETNFPPKQFHTERWLEFLELCGLKRTVTGDFLLRYAEKIEEEGKLNPSKKTEYKAKLVCKELEHQDERTLFQLKHIEFVPLGTVPTELSNLHPQFLREDDEELGVISYQFIPFQDSVMYEDLEQCWTVAKVLPAWLLPFMESGILQKRLGVQNPVKLTALVQHCVRLTRKLSRLNLRHKKPNLITDAMNKIYGHLGARAETEGAKSLEELRKEPCVWISDCNSFVFPQQVAVALPEKEQILPYLHKLPRTLLRHVDLMTSIGVKSDPDHTHYMMVLKMIKDEVGNSDLASDVNKMVAASEAIIRCLPLLYKAENIQCEFPLYMLSRQNNLEVSSELYHVDQSSWENRIANIVFPSPLLCLPDQPIIQMHFLKYIKIIPEALRPKKLSGLLEEVLDEESLACSSPMENSTTDWFKDHIENHDFCLGLQRLLRHDALEQDYVEDFEKNWAELMKRLMKIEFYTVDKLVTFLKYKDGEVIPGSNSGRQKVYIKTSAIGCAVYVVNDDRRGKVAISRDIGKYSKLLRMIIKESFPKLLPQISELLEALLRTPMNDISSTLDEYNITQCTSLTSKMYPTLGSFIPLSYHGLLTPDFLQFFTGEYIGFELEDPLNEGRAGQATYIYAKVVKALPFDDTEMEINRQYKIDIGDRKVNVFSSSMYKLSRHTLLTSAGNLESQTFDLEKVKHQVAADLDFAFYKLNVEQRNRVLKRMVMKWQPNNHPEHRDIAETILRFIDEKIKKIENDANLPEARGGSGGTKWYGVDSISRYASQRAKEQREHVQQQRKRLAANDRARRAIDDADDYSFLSETGRNPQPGEAKRLYRQAAKDLQASLNDIPNGDFEWALYKCHQAAEKSLKAVYYMQDSEQFKHHDLRMHAEILDDRDLLQLADAIAGELGDGMMLRYPDRLSYPKIPHDLYEKDTCMRIHAITKSLLQRAESYLV
ncbi:sacsin-like [Lineus longissimus]|uniref:sacsin-like n=1 Tax=Lineus longissimus TaxID=88925 RepID=UPI00315D8A43